MDHDSSHIASSRYDPSSRSLEVTFRSGPVYRYHNVPPDTATAFQDAKSQGSHLHSKIAGKFRCTKLDA